MISNMNTEMEQPKEIVALERPKEIVLEQPKEAVEIERPKEIVAIHAGREVHLQEAQYSESELSPGFYVVNFSPMTGYFLTKRDKFTIPKKVYGSNQKFIDRALKAFMARGRGMGVLLSGDKGAGKTVTAKMLANQCDIPVIMIQEGYHGQPLTEFLEKIQVPAMIFIDEFEKTYIDNNARNYFLGLLDGVATNRHLFMLTTNTTDIGEYFLSRPGRIRYHKEFYGVDDQMITDMVHDNIKDKKLAEAVINTALSLTNISFDSLASIIEESLLFNEPPKEFMEFFNVSSDTSMDYDLTLEKHKWGVDRMYNSGLNRSERSDLGMILSTLSDYGVTDLKGTRYDGLDDYIKEIVEKHAKHITYKRAVYQKLYVTDPFEINGHECEVDVYGLREQGVSFSEADEARCDWNSTHIKAFKRERRVVTIEHHDGSVLTCKPRKAHVSRGGFGDW